MLRRKTGPVCLIICLMGNLMVYPGVGSCEDPLQVYLLQRMKIAVLRIQKGEPAAKGLMADLIREAAKAGMAVPAWASSRPTSPFSPRLPKRSDFQVTSSRYDSLINGAAAKYRLPSALIKAVIQVESAFMSNAVSGRGAQGLMQLMPGTANDIGVDDPFDPKANIRGGAMLLRKYLDEFRSIKKALIAYNAGPEWVRQKKGIPTETRRYIRNVIALYRRY